MPQPTSTSKPQDLSDPDPDSPTATATAQMTVPTPAPVEPAQQVALPPVATDPVVHANPQSVPAQTVSAPASPQLRKQPRQVADVPVAVIPVTNQPAPETQESIAPPQRSSETPAVRDFGINIAAATTLPSRLPETKVAFTAVLTPMKDTATADATPDLPLQAVTMPDATGPAPTPTPVAPAAAAVPSAPALPAAGLVPATAPGAGGNTQQNGNTPSEQGESEQAPAAPAPVSTDARNKTIPVKETDDPQPLVTSSPGAPVEHTSTVTAPANPVHTTAGLQTDIPAAKVTPSEATAEALRTSESNLAPAAPLKTGAAQEITIRIDQPDASPVDLRVVERSGQLHVDVRTPDAAMQSSLRADLGTLTNSLQRAGYHAETFTPSGAARTASGPQMSNPDNQQDPSRQRGGSSDFSEGRRRKQQSKNLSSWLEEMEDPS